MGGTPTPSLAIQNGRWGRLCLGRAGSPALSFLCRRPRGAGATLVVSAEPLRLEHGGHHWACEGRGVKGGTSGRPAEVVVHALRRGE